MSKNVTKTRVLRCFQKEDQPVFTKIETAQGPCPSHFARNRRAQALLSDSFRISLFLSS